MCRAWIFKHPLLFQKGLCFHFMHTLVFKCHRGKMIDTLYLEGHILNMGWNNWFLKEFLIFCALAGKWNPFHLCVGTSMMLNQACVYKTSRVRKTYRPYGKGTRFQMCLSFHWFQLMFQPQNQFFRVTCHLQIKEQILCNAWGVIIWFGVDFDTILLCLGLQDFGIYTALGVSECCVVWECLNRLSLVYMLGK